MARTPAGTPHDPRGKERFNEERATSTVAGAQPDLAAGVAAIRETVQTLKPKPGVYRMLDARGEVLYVGKARSLKARVANYTQVKNLTNRLQRMVGQTRGMEIVTTNSEAEALLLEAQFIKRFRPPFNVLLRDDKSFPFILLRADHAFPRIMKHRGARRAKGNYYGPFASAGSVNKTINALQKLFLLRSCSDSFFANRDRPCLLYQIKRCSAPCTGRIDEAGYAELVGEAKDFLGGKSSAVQGKIEQQMAKAAEALDFETAAILRDRLRAATFIQGSQAVNAAGVGDADVFALAAKGGQIGVQAFFIRGGQNWGHKAFFPKNTGEIDKDDVLADVLLQFYEEVPPPRTILTDRALPEQELIAEALAAKAGHAVAISVPQRGDRRRLMEQASRNATEALERRLAETGTKATLNRALAEFLELEEPPKRIELYDNSHIQGTKAVGAMVVATPDGFDKGQYRKFNIKTAAGNDDFAMMREVMQRRFRKLAEDESSPSPDGEGDHPQDGGGVNSALAGKTPPQDGGRANSPPAGNTPPPPAAVPLPGAAGEDRGVARKPARPPSRGHEAVWPDLVLIDGGKGQMSAVRDTLAEMGIDDVPLVAIAKGPDHGREGREVFHFPDGREKTLPVNSPLLFHLQRLRDEVHRYAIGAHRAKRSRAITASPLDEIPGIGPSRKRALLLHFGTAGKVRAAALADLTRVPGISAAVARQVYDFYHAGG
ncbi:excinuclease ABC subunit UvrC [Qipengyuania sp. DY56-A-20]|jgi:excinuclease ABC subunit C|uniref:UvrABC system protein C n=1 Tax=Qipengyuania benthica TaxID=3067651 RepID=A0ABT9H6T7_9SPHN|nr:excinuclease ABC subunit UvrC [Qipengyuania sp. DY56-A-20]MDP4539031.1 excinuclease ABC subunit UvrC [Qipengyuania sp. DY56-A-20]